MQWHRIRQFASDGARLAIGLVLFVFAILKAGHPQITANALHTALEITLEAASAATLILIVLEILLGAVLLSGYRKCLSMGIGTGVFLLFVSWNLWLYSRGLFIDCGCGPSGTEADPVAALQASIWRSGGFFMISLIGFVFAYQQRVSPLAGELRGYDIS